MTLAKRLDALEDHHLTPKEAVILWMKEAHQFGSLLEYGRWLMEQSKDHYPLHTMPRQVRAAIRASHKGVPEVRLSHQFQRAERDLLFLYHLHKQVNLHVLEQEEALQLKLALLAEKLRSLIFRIYGVDRDRLDRLELPEDPKQPLPTRERAKEEVALEKDIVAWPREEALLWGEVTSVKQAERLVSERYLSGESLLFPGAAEALETTLDTIGDLGGIYDSVLEGRPPEAYEDIVRWLSGEAHPSKSDTREPAKDSAFLRFDTRRAARALAERFVVMARAQALEDLGEQDAGICLVEEWIRSVEFAEEETATN